MQLAWGYADSTSVGGGRDPQWHNPGPPTRLHGATGLDPHQVYKSGCNGTALEREGVCCPLVARLSPSATSPVHLTSPAGSPRKENS